MTETDDIKKLREMRRIHQLRWVQKNRTNVVCPDCGKVVKRYYLARHKRSNYHKECIKKSIIDIENLEIIIKNLEIRIKKLEDLINKPFV